MKDVQKGDLHKLFAYNHPKCVQKFEGLRNKVPP